MCIIIIIIIIIVMVTKFYNKDEYIKGFIILSTPFLHIPISDFEWTVDLAKKGLCEWLIYE